MSSPLQTVEEYFRGAGVVLEATTSANAGAYQVPLGAEPMRVVVGRKRRLPEELGSGYEPVFVPVKPTK